MIEKRADTLYANIWIAGDYAEAVTQCRRFCMANPLCVTVTPTNFVYVGGAQDGVLVRLINYPRFPRSANEIKATSRALADHLLKELCQESYSIEWSDETLWVSHRPEDQP